MGFQIIDKLLYKISFFTFIEKHLERKKIKKIFKNERLLIHGKINDFNGLVKNNPSILHFSLNKAATQYVKSILVKIAIDSNMQAIHLHEYAFYSNFPFLNALSSEEMKNYDHIFKKEGFVYTAFGGYIKRIKNINEYKVILVIRDPRDILVSNYYSIGISHPPPAKHADKIEYFNKKRLEARTTSINSFVINNFKDLKNNYLDYIQNIQKDCPECLILKYEDMVSDIQNWLTTLFKYLGKSTDSKLFISLLEESKYITPKVEDSTKHVRKGKPGDYKEKLSAETIQILNKEFKDILKHFNYSI